MEISSSSGDGSNSRAFFQPLLPDFLDSFSIPGAFLEKELKVKFESVVLMREKKGKEKMKHWVVKIKGGRHLNSDDWKRFALHHQLKVGDFVIFRHLGNFLFHVSVFDSLTACDSLTPKQPQTQPQQEEAEVQVPYKKELPCYQFTLTPYSAKKHIIYLPRRLMAETGLGRRRCVVKLIDPKKRRWEVKLGYKRCDGQSYIAGGWKAFQDGNALKANDVITFQPLSVGKSPVVNCYLK